MFPDLTKNLTLAFLWKTILNICAVAVQNFWRLQQDFAKSFLHQSVSQVLLCKVAWWNGWKTQHIWLASQFLMSWRSRQPLFRRDSTDMQKVEKERASLTEDDTEVFTDLSYKNRNKRFTSSSCWSIWLAWLEALALFLLSTKETEDVLMKWDFTRLMKLY